MLDLKFLSAVRRPVLLLLCLLVMISLTLAQGGRDLQPGVSVNGALDAANPAQVYTYTASAAETISVGATAQQGLALTLLVTDAQGTPLGRASDTSASGSVSLLNLALPAAGTYYVTIFPTAGVATVSVGAFRLTLETGAGGEAQATEPAVTEAATDAPTTEATPDAAATEASTPDAPEATPTTEVSTQTTPEPAVFQPGQVLTTSGLQVSLTWDTTSDLNLQVRDPVGQTLFFDSRLTNNGGEFGFDVNGLCEVLTPDNPTETATWSPGAIATGSYEILVFYRSDCENVGPVDFTVNVTVDGVALTPIQATLPTPINDVVPVYLASFVVNADGTARLGANGQHQDTRVLPMPAADLLAQPAQAVQLGTPIQGTITSGQYYQLYSFDGVTGETYAISMTRQQGSLDTLLLVLDQNGQIVADNDDIVAADVTDSAIDNPAFLAPVDGKYTIMATRYGKDVGGTEGTYQLLVDRASVQLPEDVANLNLPTGDIQVTLTWNTAADLRLLVRDPAGDSVFNDQRQIGSGGQLVATGNINCTVSPTTPVSYIYWPTNLARGGTYEVDVLNRNACNDTRIVSANLYVTVRGQLVINETITNLQQAQRYLISFTIDPTTGTATAGQGGIIGGSETLLGYQNEVPNAIEILPGSQPLFGNITADNKYDVYVFSGTAGQFVTIDMQATQGILDTLLFLISPSGLQVATNDDAAAGETTDSRIARYQLPETGDYVILATHFGTIYGGTTGSYSLTLTVESGAAPTATSDATTPTP